MSIESVVLSKHLILCCSILLALIFSSIRVFSSGSALHIRGPKYWSFSFSISSSNEYSGLISFRIDWFDLLAVQGTLKSLLQHHNLKASILCPQNHAKYQYTKPVQGFVWSFNSVFPPLDAKQQGPRPPLRPLQHIFDEETGPVTESSLAPNFSFPLPRLSVPRSEKSP